MLHSKFRIQVPTFSLLLKTMWHVKNDEWEISVFGCSPVFSITSVSFGHFIPADR